MPDDKIPNKNLSHDYIIEELITRALLKRHLDNYAFLCIENKDRENDLLIEGRITSYKNFLQNDNSSVKMDTVPNKLKPIIEKLINDRSIDTRPGESLADATTRHYINFNKKITSVTKLFASPENREIYRLAIELGQSHKEAKSSIANAVKISGDKQKHIMKLKEDIIVEAKRIKPSVFGSIEFPLAEKLSTPPAQPLPATNPTSFTDNEKETISFIFTEGYGLYEAYSLKNSTTAEFKFQQGEWKNIIKKLSNPENLEIFQSIAKDKPFDIKYFLAKGAEVFDSAKSFDKEISEINNKI